MNDPVSTRSGSKRFSDLLTLNPDGRPHLYGMMSDIYRHVFDEPCAKIDEIGLVPQYYLHERRIAVALIEAGIALARETVAIGAAMEKHAELRGCCPSDHKEKKKEHIHE